MLKAKDVLSKKFKKKLFGYSKTQVDSFTSEVIDSLDTLTNENAEVKNNLRFLYDEIELHKENEKMLKSTLETTASSKDELVKSITERYEKEMDNFRTQLADSELKLKTEKDSLYAKIRSLEADLSSYKEIEQSMRSSLLYANETKLKIEDEARRKASEIVERADNEAREKMDSLNENYANVQENYKYVKDQYMSFANNYKQQLEEELQRINEKLTLFE